MKLLLLSVLVAGSGFWTDASAATLQVPPPAAAQEALRNMSREEIRRRIADAGLTEAQIRDRLRQSGYDPSLADRYFGDLGDTELLETSPQDAQFLQVLRNIGVSLTPSLDSLRVEADSFEAAEESAQPAADSTGLRVFGLEVFRRRSSQFEASLTGPVGPTYPLGPGDEVFLVLTGDVEAAYTLPITREGTMIVPGAGQIAVNGMTLGQLEDVLYGQLGRIYSGLARGPEATTRFSLSLGRLRTSQVYVVGEVLRPGAYRLSSVATLLEGLYAAGGPTEAGSFRQVSVRRRGATVGAFDLYDYLTAGQTEGAPRLQEGDVVFVPPVGPQVSVEGAVRRPAIYEVVEGEGLRDLFRYSGGLLPHARTDVVRVERIVPPLERSNGRDREVVDVDFDRVVMGFDLLELRAGDDVQVFSLREDRRGWVEIDGAVYRPGRYELRDGTTVASLVEQAGGEMPDALNSIVHIRSLDQSDGSRRLVRIPLSVASSVPLREFDQITLFGRDSLLAADSVGIYGLVNRPGRYVLPAGASAEDLILLAGGFAFGADPRRAEVTRMVSAGGDGASVSRSIEVSLSPDLPYPGPADPDSLPPLPTAAHLPHSLVLEPGDEVYVRQVPRYRRVRRVEVAGEVSTPGTYVLQTMDERVSSLVRRAGGLTDRAFVSGFRLIRDGITVGVDLALATANPGTPSDPVLNDGDRLVVPVYDATVLVSGAVAFETRVVFQRGMDLDDALSEAGGVLASADKGRISVEYANGSRRTVKRILGINVDEPDIRPGATVYVPEAPEQNGFDWDTAVSRILAVASTLATVIVAVR